MSEIVVVIAYANDISVIFISLPKDKPAQHRGAWDVIFKKHSNKV
jgi:hypothetical protein